MNSKGHGFVFTRSNSASGPAYAPAAAQLLEVRNLLQELEQLALDREHLADVFDNQAVVRHGFVIRRRDGLPAAHCRAASLEREGVALLQRGHSHARAWVLGVPFSTASFSPLAYAHGDRRHSSLTCWWSRHAKLRHIACERQFTSQRGRYLRGFPRGDSWDKSCSELPC